ncbi:MAG: NADH-quinone oxidoreductase subunit I [Candidatus Marsarchaeota archaeon]|nr:NADH-quinone oxidoreductase subunit I [Candidatus Marsarchaeota archaeon]
MIVKSMATVLKEMAKRPTTLEFPDEKEDLTDNYRGVHKLDMKTCISCSACARICPNQTITMVDVETERGPKKMPEINLERCLFCALCEEVCPTRCLILTKDYDFAKYDRREYVKAPQDLE